MRFEGTLKSWEQDRGFGFLQPDQGGDEIFVHIKAIVNREGRPAVGQRFTFEVEVGPHGKKRAKSVLPYKAPAAIKPRRGTETRQPEPAASWSLAAAAAIPAFFLIFGAAAVVWGLPPYAAAVYLIASCITFFAYALDKSAAIRQDQRTPENTLHFLALVGGWPGALIAQQLLRHKTTKLEFRRVFWITVVLNESLFVFIASPFGRSLWAQ